VVIHFTSDAVLLVINDSGARVANFDTPENLICQEYNVPTPRNSQMHVDFY
jgi:hypothetical protein